jgi:hypothetical protein
MITSISHAATISPASFCLEKFDIGMNMDLGISFTMSNVKNSGPIVLNVKQPPANRVLKGYIPIPDPSWLYFLNPQVVPGKNGVASARMFLKVPNQNKYLNQHWMVHVGAAPPSVSLFSMEMVGVYMIETRASKTITERPYGKLGIVPSRVYANRMKPDQKKSASFVIYNNDKILHDYQISVHTFEPSIYTKLQISQAPGFEWVKDTKWIQLAHPSLSIPANQKKETTVWVTIPKNVQYKGEGFEAIIIVESKKNDGPNGFARLLISF